MKRISVIGAGAMGGAIAAGLSRAGYSVTVSNRSRGKLDALAAEYGVAVTLSNVEAVKDADVVIFAVKPYVLSGVIAEVTPAIDYSRTVVASLVPGYTLADLREALGTSAAAAPIARVMPNTAAAVGKSMTFVCLNDEARCHEDLFKAMFDSIGTTAVVDERLFGAATALCSCGIAYAMRYIRAASEGGVELGFRASEACEYVCRTVEGAAALIEAQKIHPEAAIDNVTTPGGLTIKGLNAMEKSGFTAAVIDGLKASAGK